jgi:hypothetical protein
LGRRWRDVQSDVELGAHLLNDGAASLIVTGQRPLFCFCQRSIHIGALFLGDLRHRCGVAHLIDGLSWAAPNVTLIDGRGARFTPYSTDPTELARHTVMEQPTTTYDFACSLRVTLREYAPDVLLRPGPGASLGEVCAQIIVAEGYHAIRSRADLETIQSGASPILLSMRR